MFVKNVLRQNLVFFLFREVNTNVSASMCNNIPWNNKPKKIFNPEKVQIRNISNLGKVEKRKISNPEKPKSGKFLTKKKNRPLKIELPFCR